jgi:hypothetical protein
VLETEEETITVTKTKGTATLSISDTTGYTGGRLVRISYENETDTNRITLGAVPVWHSLGAPFIRSYLGKITAVVANTSITVEPPLPGDGTSLAMKSGLHPTDSKTTNWGFEDFSVTFDSAQHPTSIIYMDAAEQCWVHNVDFEDWSKTTASGSCVVILNSYRCEIRKCKFNAETGSDSDGAVGTGSGSSHLIIDNIFTGDWDYMVYDNGNACNSIIAYNFSSSSGGTTLFHNAHPCLNLIEGNYMTRHQSDGYHGSGSHNTVFKNCLIGASSLVVNRFKRKYVIAGNILGIDGATTGAISWGNPNIGNGSADGFAGPTGLSDQEGEIDYAQPGYGVGGGSINTYVIQSADISVNDFWSDWNITGTLTTRTSDTVGTFAAMKGKWFTGASLTGGGDLLVYARDSAGTIYNYNGSVTGVANETNVTISFSSGVLPSVSTVVYLYMSATGWQERDLDVQASSTVVENYFSSASGTGSVQDGVADTLPDSLMYAAKPTFFFGLSWPPFDPNSYATADSTRIPAGYRYANGDADPPEGGSPAASSRPARFRGIRFR